MFTPAFLTIAKKWKNPKDQLLMNEQNVVQPYNRRASGNEKNQVLIHAVTGMNFKSIMPSERSQSLMKTNCIIPFIWNVPNRQIYKDRK